MLEPAVLNRDEGARLVWQLDLFVILLCPCPELAIDIFVGVQRLSRLPQRYTMMLLQAFDCWLCLCKLSCPCLGLAIVIFVDGQRLSRPLQHCAMMVLQVFGGWPCL